MSGNQSDEGFSPFPHRGQELKVIRVHPSQQIQHQNPQLYRFQCLFIGNMQVNAAAEDPLMLGGGGSEVDWRSHNARKPQRL